MLNKKHKLLELKTKSLVNSLFIGNYKTNFKGSGLEFIDYKEYEYSDNSKNIDFIKSEITGKTLVKLYEEKRELSIYFIIDLNESFFEEFFSKKTKYDILIEILYLIGLSGISGGDKVGGLFSYEKYNLFQAKKGKQNFINIVNSLEKIRDLYLKEKNKKSFLNIFNKKINLFTKNNLSYFNNLKIKNSLVFYLTDKVELDIKQLKVISSKNDLIFCNIFNSFENDLSGEGIISSNNFDFKIDLSDSKKIDEYKKRRIKNISSLKKNIIKFGGTYLSFDEKIDIYKVFYKIFKK